MKTLQKKTAERLRNRLQLRDYQGEKANYKKIFLERFCNITSEGFYLIARQMNLNFVQQLFIERWDKYNR